MSKQAFRGPFHTIGCGALYAVALSFFTIQSDAGTRLLRMPTVSADHIAFAYANNIWIVDRKGGIARRLTSFQGQTTNPHLSPDGKLVAFSGEYGGNMDVYVVGVEGGEPKRLTWHPGPDLVEGWTPDGKSVLFTSTRESWAPMSGAAFLDGTGDGRLSRAFGAAARLSGKDLAGWFAHCLPHEQLVG